MYQPIYAKDGLILSLLGDSNMQFSGINNLADFALGLMLLPLDSAIKKLHRIDAIFELAWAN